MILLGRPSTHLSWSSNRTVMKTAGVSVIVLMGLVQYGSAIICYECNSATNSMCSEATLPDYLKRNCSEHDRGVTHTLCRKIIQHVDFEVKGQLPASRVIRSCGWDESKYKGACYHRSGYGGRQEVCSCSSDLCNAGDSFQIPYFVLVTIVVFFFSKSALMTCIC